MKPTSNIKISQNINNNNENPSKIPENQNHNQNNPIPNQTTSSMKYDSLNSIKNTNFYNENHFQQNHSKKFKNSKTIKKEDNPGLDVNLVLGIPFKKSQKNQVGYEIEEFQKLPRTSPYTFKYFCNTANKNALHRSLSNGGSIQKEKTQMESNFINLSKEANIYTSNADYITNKKMLLFDKYNYEDNKYRPDRARIFNMTKIPHQKDKNSTLYKTTMFRCGKKFGDSNKFSNFIVGKYNNKVINRSQPKVQFNSKIIDNSFQPKEKYVASNSLYKELMSKKDEIYDNIIKSKINENQSLISSINRSHPYDDSKPIDNNISNNKLNKTTFKFHNFAGYSNLLSKKDPMGVPLTFPVVCSNNAKCKSVSQRTRFQNIMETFIKLKSLIDNDRQLGKNNEYDYINEFLIIKRIDKKNITKKNIHNFYEFLSCKEVPIDLKKSLKENIILGLNYDSSIKKNKKNTLQTEETETRKKESENLKKKYDDFSSSTILFEDRVLLRNSKNSNFKSLVLDLSRQNKLFKKEDNKTDNQLKDDLKKELDKVVDEVQNKQEKIQEVENNLKLLPFYDSYYNKIKAPEEKNENVDLRLMATKDMIKNDSNEIDSEKLKKQGKMEGHNVFNTNERLYYTWYREQNWDNVKNFKKKAKLTEYIIYNRTKNKIFENKLEEILKDDI